MLKRNTLLIISGLAVGGVLGYLFVLPILTSSSAHPDQSAEMAVWPWPDTKAEVLQPGVTHWLNKSSQDGSILDLLEFDFTKNPKLRLELYDQDQDDSTPGDSRSRFFEKGVAQAAAQLNTDGKDTVVAAWNGLFFGYTYDLLKGRDGYHLAPVILNGKVFCNVGNYRWTFGVKYDDGKPVFKTLHMPTKSVMAREFDFGSSGAQCLIKDGKALRMEPYPNPGQQLKKQPVPSTPEEAGHIPSVDFLRTSRTSLGWSKDSDKLYVLIVKEPDSETSSSKAMARRQVDPGWLVSDLQAFWKAKGVWGAVNLDGGELTQSVFRLPGGRYQFIPAHWASAQMRLVLSADLKGASTGGSMMYFFVREAK